MLTQEILLGSPDYFSLSEGGSGHDTEGKYQTALKILLCLTKCEM